MTLFANERGGSWSRLGPSAPSSGGRRTRRHSWPTSNHGKICYLQIPAIDAEASARFYHEVFGWPLRSHDDGTPAFDDSTGQVSGMWVTGRKPWAGEPGLLVDIMVDDAEETVASIVAHGGEIVQPIGWEAPELTAAFRDPAGNILGIYQEPPQ